MNHGDQPESITYGDHVAGDKIAGDKVAGDKVIVNTFVQSTPIEIPPPPAPASLPDLDNFIGRQQELDEYEAELRRSGLIFIAGIAGVGKTSLTTALAQRISVSGKIFWHSFHPQQGLEVLIRQLAAFLAWHQNDRLWCMVERPRLTGGQPQSAEVLLDYLSQFLKETKHLLCLDDFQYIDADPLLKNLMECLVPLAHKHDIYLIINSRHRLASFHNIENFKLLTGLRQPDLAQLLVSRSLPLTAEEIIELHHYTGGNTQLLTLAIELLKQTDQPGALLIKLFEIKDADTDHAQIEHYLIDEVDKHLAAAEKRVLQALAVLEQPSSRYAIEAVAEEVEDVDQALHELRTRFLLSVHSRGTQRAYQLHSMLQTFYAQRPKLTQLMQMHQRAAIFYETIESDPLRSIHHRIEGRSYIEASTQVNKYVAKLTSQGQSSELKVLVQALLSVGPIEVQMDSLLTLGAICGQQGDFAAVKTYMAQAIALDMKGEDQAKVASALLNLATAKLMSGELQPAIDDYHQALTLAKQIKNTRLIINICHNLGNLYLRSDDAANAATFLQQAQALAAQNKLYPLDTIAQISLAELATRVQDWDSAELRLNQVEQLNTQIDSPRWSLDLVYIRALIALARDQIDEADQHITTYLAVARNLDMPLEEGRGLRLQGEIALKRKDYETAAACFDHSLKLLSQDQYEAAYTKVKWAGGLIKCGKLGEGKALLCEAQVVLARFGAQRYLAEVDVLLQSIRREEWLQKMTE